jgi:hypothetical protein
MVNLQEKMEVLTTQYSQIVQQVNDAVTMKTKEKGLTILRRNLKRSSKW